MWQREHPEENKSDFTLRAELNVLKVSEPFKGNETIKIRRFTTEGSHPIGCALIYTENMSSLQDISERLIRCIINSEISEYDPINEIYLRTVCECDVKTETSLEKVTEALTYGDCVLFADGSKKALIANVKSWTSRPPIEPENEKVLRGPREGFTEKISDSIALIQRRICDPNLKIGYLNVGERSNTRVAICYLEGIAKPELVEDIKKKLSEISIDGILDSNYIAELITKRRFYPFKLIGTTERPDTAAAKILEGRVVLLVNGSPVALTLPYLFIENFQSADDYFVNYLSASIGRLLRIISFILAISVPAVYVALVTVHKEMMPTNLALSIIAARSSVPFPVIVEAIGLITVFEIIRETALRMNSNVSQAFSIVGAIVIGDAAVKAKFVSVPIVIIVSLSALTGLMIPRLRSAVALYRMLLVLLAGFFGLYGYMLGTVFMATTLISAESFGVRYTSYISIPSLKNQNDIYLRLPWPFMKRRPENIALDKKRI